MSIKKKGVLVFLTLETNLSSEKHINSFKIQDPKNIKKQE